MKEDRLNELERLKMKVFIEFTESGAVNHLSIKEADYDDLIAAARERNEIRNLIGKQCMAVGLTGDEHRNLQNMNSEQALSLLVHSYNRERDTLRANNAALREALEDLLARIRKEFPGHYDRSAHMNNEISGAEDVLASTPADSLTEYRNGVLEELAARFDGGVPIISKEDDETVSMYIRTMKTGQ